MSCCEVYAIRENGDVELYGEARNSWGGAWHIWTCLNKKYGFEQENFPGCDFGPMPTFNQLWDYISKMPEPDQWVLGCTLDNVLVMREWLPKLIGHLASFADQHSTPTLLGILYILRRALADSEVIGVCFNHTSVNYGKWLVSADTPDGYERAFNIYKDDALKPRLWSLTPDSFA